MSAKGAIDEFEIQCSCFEWEVSITDMSQTSGPDEFFTSPTFPFLGDTWRLIMYPNGYYRNGWISVYLKMELSKDSDSKTVAFNVGVKKSKGITEETEPLYHTFENANSTCGWSSLWSLEDVFKRKAEMTESGVMTITCRIVDDVSPPNLKAVQKSMKFTELETLSSDLKDLFISKNNCDANLKVKEEVFEVHRAILMARSAVFTAMFEHQTSEKETGVVSIDDCDLDSFSDFLQYLYTGKIESISFGNAYHLYVTADKYQVRELKSFCASYMMLNLSVENVCDVISLAERYDDTGLMSSGQRFFNKHFDEICSTSEWKKLLKNNYLLSYKLLEEMASTSKKESKIN